MNDQTAHLDLDNHEVDPKLYDRANEMTALFHEHCMLWARQDDFPEGIFDFTTLGDKGDTYIQELGYYWGFRASNTNPTHDPLFEYSMINAYIAVSDELGGFDLVGFYEDNQLTYLIARVDTSWAEVWIAEYPSGLIDTDHPFVRKGRFTNTPTDSTEGGE